MSKIQKAPGATTNSFVTFVKDSMSIYPKTQIGQRINVGVMFTSDDNGETLSVLDPSTKKQIIISFEEVAQLIEHTRREREVQTGGDDQ